MVRARTSPGLTPRVRILLVDDSARVVEALGLHLGKQPGLCVVATGHTGEQALVEMERHQPDLVVLDLNMPGMGGLAAAVQIRRLHRTVRIVIISIEQGARVQAECLRSGADGFLPKIGLQRHLIPQIEQWFPGGA